MAEKVSFWFLFGSFILAGGKNWQLAIFLGGLGYFSGSVTPRATSTRKYIIADVAHLQRPWLR